MSSFFFLYQLNLLKRKKSAIIGNRGNRGKDDGEKL